MRCTNDFRDFLAKKKKRFIYQILGYSTWRGKIHIMNVCISRALAFVIAQFARCRVK